MAVANRQKGRAPKSYELILEDGQTVNVVAVRGGQTVGSERELQQLHRELQVIQGRIEYLTQQAVQAPDDKEYESKLRYVKKFEKNYADIQPQIQQLLLQVLTDWDIALEEEDERRGNYVPLTLAGLQSLDPMIVVDVFNKLMDKFKEGDEEKKEPSGSSRDGTAVKANSESVQIGTSTTN